MRDAKEDPNLAEVKAVLKKLQRLDLPSNGDIERDQKTALHRPSPAKNAPPPVRSGMDVFDRKHAAIAVRPVVPKSKLPIYMLGGAIIIGGGAALFATGIVKSPGSRVSQNPAAPAQNKEAEALLVRDARRMLSEGDVTQARARLLLGGPTIHAELAFMLAQSYDPNYLRTLPKANGAPDRSEAERWYKKWYELAISSGLEMDSERLNRIINAMK